MAFLAEMVARVFGVKFYTSHGSDHWNKPAKRTIHYYGPDERPQIAAYSFEVLGKQLAKARREYIATMRKNIKPATKGCSRRYVLLCMGQRCLCRGQ
jgi:hypothetical protein